MYSSIINYNHFVNPENVLYKESYSNKKICVIQADNRINLDYLKKTSEVNKMWCDYLNYDYLFIEIKVTDNIHPAIKKINVVDDFLQNQPYDVLIFLDSDAWIQNGKWLNDIINNLIQNHKKNGCFSRDPYVKKNTFINSGSFILKINEFTKKMYKTIINELMINSYYNNVWPWDQFYISNYVFNNKEYFDIFIPDILNTPLGKILRHNWLKNKKMYDDLNDLISNKNMINNMINNYPFNFNDYYDKENFPNIDINGYEYFE